MEFQPRTPTAKGPAEWFNGDVHFDVIAHGEAPSRLRVNLVASRRPRAMVLRGCLRGSRGSGPRTNPPCGCGPLAPY